MNWDFATILSVAVLVTGGIWLADVLLWKPGRKAAAEEIKAREGDAEQVAQAYKEPILVEYARSFFPVILIVLLLRSFLVEPFRIPSGSMMPTLLKGDFILVSKYAYGIRLPVLNAKVLDLGQPERGDVAVFRYPDDPSIDFIKRVVGLPGDKVAYINKQILINGEPVPQKHLGAFVGRGESLAMSGDSLRLEILGDGEHEILLENKPSLSNGTYVVPEGHYFVMGDNRDNSNDSRRWGYVPDENLVGRAFMIWMNWDSVDKRVSWERIGDMIK